MSASFPPALEILFCHPMKSRSFATIHVEIQVLITRGVASESSNDRWLIDMAKYDIWYIHPAN